MADTNIVTLSVSSYNQIKSENFRYALFLDNILQLAELSSDHQSLVFKSEDIDKAIRFCYYERYNKKRATLKGQFNKYGSKLPDKEEDKDDK